MEDLIGKTLGNYRVMEEIGRGGMGVVYRASQMSLNRVVALKILPPQFTFDPSFITRFKREAAAAAKLDHSGIVKIFDIGQEGDIHFFSMEFLKGENLENVLQREGKLSVRKSLDITVRVARALHYAHGQGITHRDIKPSNIMVDRSSQIKVTDFGLALPAGGTRITATGGILGTPEYMSPEQAAGGEVGPQSDIYSLGIVLYEMLTGKVPFQADTPGSLMQQHMTVEPKKVTQIISSIPQEVETILDKMLAKDLEERYQTAKELVSDLSEIRSTLKGATTQIRKKESQVGTAQTAQPVETAKTGEADEAKERGRKWLLPVVAGAVLVVAVGLWALVGGGGERDAPSPADTPTAAVERAAGTSDQESAQEVALLRQDLEQKERLLNTLLSGNEAVASAVTGELDRIEAAAGPAAGQIEALEEQIEVVEDALVNRAWLGLDVLLLKTGSDLKGSIISEDANAITLKTEFGTYSVEKDRIVSIRKARPAERRLGAELREKIAARQVEPPGIIARIRSTIGNLFSGSAKPSKTRRR